jgi:hypothetical protein
MKNLVRHHHDGNILILRTNNLLKSPPLQANYCITLNLNTMDTLYECGMRIYTMGDIS